MKKITALFAALVLVLTGFAPAQAEDAYNADNVIAPDKTATFLIGEEGSSQHFSTLTAFGKQNSKGEASEWTCDSVLDASCSQAKAVGLAANAIFPICAEDRNENCVVSLELTNALGEFEKATYQRNAGGMNFASNSRFKYPGGTTPSLWEASFAQSASGTTKYSVVVRARLFMQWSERKFKAENLVAFVTPYRDAPYGGKAPTQTTVESNHRGVRGVGIDGHGYECAWNEAGTCGITQDFAPGVRVRLTLRLSSEIGGWFKGRIKNPTINVKKFSSSTNTLTVEAEPASVAKMIYQSPLEDLSKTETKYAMDNGMAGGWDGGFISWAEASRSSSFNYIEFFRKKIKDTSSGINTHWNFATVKSEDPNNCLSDTSKVLGIVTTNSMIYDGGVPKFSNGFLDYKVAGLHYEPDGTTAFEGSYDLVMRSDTARCLYGFSKAPLSATVSVVNSKGVKSQATTTVSEDKGWLKLAAYGFTFSKKTIKVKITKKKKK